MFVEGIDQVDKTPGFIVVVGTELWDRDHDDGVISPGDGEIISGAQWIRAQPLKRKHCDAARGLGHKQRPTVNVQFFTRNFGAVGDVAVGQAEESRR